MTKELKRFRFTDKSENYSFSFLCINTGHIYSVKDFIPVEAPKILQLTKKYNSLDEILKDYKSAIKSLCPRDADSYVIGENYIYDGVTALPIQFYERVGIR